MNLLFLFGVLILIALVIWAVPQLLAAIGVPPNIAKIIYVCLVCLIVLWVVSTFFGVGPGPGIRVR
jgi:hypothetical protein